jgi:outer membrane protein insertion porin family
MRFLRNALLALTVLLAVSAPTTASAQQPPLEIGTITIRFLDLQNLNEEVALANLRARSGAPFSEALLDRDIRTLFQTGLFESVDIRRETVGNKVNLTYELRPKYRVGSVLFEGNNRLSARRLTREIKTADNGPLDERQVRADAQAIFELYQKSGYPGVTVDYTIQRNPVTGRGSVVFRIVEGPRIRIRSIAFTGRGEISERQLRRAMETTRWGMFSWLTGKGRFKDETFEDDLNKIRDLYLERGYLDVEIDRAAVRLEYPSPDRMDITIPIQTGRRYNVGEITVVGNTIIPTERIRSALSVRTGDIFVPSKLDADRQTVSDLYGRDGYLDTDVDLIRRPNLQTGAIDIEYRVREGGKFRVESLIIEGNTKTRTNVIVRELVLAPGDTFDTVRMRISEQRLRNTRFFGEGGSGRGDSGVTVSPEVTPIPDRRNLKVQVREGQTGSLTVGAGFSSLERAVVFAEVSQSNFDLFNYRSMFQGDGQKFRLRLQLGSRTSEALLAFEEPWLFERELALGFQVFRQSSSLPNQGYDLVSTGIEVYLRKRLFELWEGRVSLGWTDNQFSDVVPALAPLIRDGKVSQVSLTLLRDTRDSLVTTTRGNRVELRGDIAGPWLGGDEDFYRLEARGSQFFPIFEAQRQVISVIARTGVVEAYDRNKDPNNPRYTQFEVPYSERYFLGGPSTLRGFEFRDVGPRGVPGSASTARGGRTFGFGSVEYSLDVVDPIRFAVFYDIGFANEDAYDWNVSNYNDNFGFGLRIFIMGAPLSLDYGIPITTDQFNDRGGQFNFSFGTRF